MAIPLHSYNAMNSIITGTTTTATTTGWLNTTNYIVPQNMVYNDKPIKTKVANNFPFKKSTYKGLSDQLQGEFDSWIGNLRKEIFSV